MCHMIDLYLNFIMLVDHIYFIVRQNEVRSQLDAICNVHYVFFIYSFIHFMWIYVLCVYVVPKVT